jgi:hypothetical protein
LQVFANPRNALIGTLSQDGQCFVARLARRGLRLAVTAKTAARGRESQPKTKQKDTRKKVKNQIRTKMGI